MIDFSTLKGLTIPEGNVKQISDAQGNVLWSAKPSEATVTITGSGGTVRAGCYVAIDGENCTIPSILTVPLGTVITCTAYDGDKKYSSVKFNGTLVAGHGDNASYSFPVVGNVTIACEQYQDSDRARYSEIAITEQ